MENAEHDTPQPPDKPLIDAEIGATQPKVAKSMMSPLIDSPIALAAGRIGIELVASDQAEQRPRKQEETPAMRQLPIPHEHIPKQCTCTWVPVDDGLWKRTDKPFPGLPECGVNHELAALQRMSTQQLRSLARELGLSSTTRLQKRSELALAIAKVVGSFQQPV